MAARKVAIVPAPPILTDMMAPKVATVPAPPVLTDITPEQAALMDVYADRWTAIGLCTDAADRAGAEAAMRDAYIAGGLPPPERIVWCGSPLAMMDARRQAAVAEGIAEPPALNGICFGQHDAHWLAKFAYYSEVLGLVEEVRPLEPLMRYAQCAGWALPHANICWCAERHTVLHLDAQGALHSVVGPACAYPDGWGVYAVHGTVVPEEWVLQRDTLDPRLALTHANVEQRRAAALLIGWERVLAQLAPRSIDRDPDVAIGELLEVDLPDSGRTRFLRVRCATGRDFVLCVPSEVRTAREANAATFGLGPHELALEIAT